MDGKPCDFLAIIYCSASTCPSEGKRAEIDKIDVLTGSRSCIGITCELDYEQKELISFKMKENRQKNYRPKFYVLAFCKVVKIPLY